MKNLKKLKIMIGSLLLLTSSLVVVYTLSSSTVNKTKGNEKIVNQGLKEFDCWIVGTGVRMRQSPSLKGAIIGYFKDGEEVEYIDSRYGWDLVRKRNGTVGYVYEDYLECGGC